jgi:ketosteroid isomerase-like protein
MSDDLKGDLDRLLKAWGRAIVSNDATEIGRFAADEWVLVDPQGGPVDSSAFLGAVSSGDLAHDSFEVEVERAFAYGEVAVSIAHVRNTGAYRGTPFSADEWATDIFVRRNGAWLCVVTALTPRMVAT